MRLQPVCASLRPVAGWGVDPPAVAGVEKL